MLVLSTKTLPESGAPSPVPVTPPSHTQNMLSIAVLSVIAGLLVGAAVTAIALRGRTAAVTQRVAWSDGELARLTAELAAVRAELSSGHHELAEALEARGRAEAALESERRAATEKMELLQATEQQLAARFDQLSAQALERNSKSFLDIAGQSVLPLRDRLADVEIHLKDLERVRQEAYGKVDAQLKSVNESQQQLRTETASLVTALRKPSTRGRWGEMQLRRVVEVAGLAARCDFTEQATFAGPDGALRPDVVVHLPGNKHVIIDAKVPLEAYLLSLEAADDATRKAALVDHGRQLRNHIDKLAAKNYGTEFPGALPFVYLFIPGEGILSAALEADPNMLEFAAAAGSTWPRPRCSWPCSRPPPMAGSRLPWPRTPSRSATSAASSMSASPPWLAMSTSRGAASARPSTTSTTRWGPSRAACW